MSHQDIKVPLTNESIVSIIHTGRVTHSDVCEDWINELKLKWHVDAVACYGESICYLVFDKQKKRFAKRETLIPKCLVNELCITVYYRMISPEDYARSQESCADMGKELLALLDKHCITPQFARILTLEERQYFGIQDTDREWREKWERGVQKLSISPEPQLKININLQPFESLAMWHIYADTRVSVEKYFHNRFFPRVGVKVYHDESTHYIIFDSKEFLDDFRADGKLSHDTMFEVLEMVKQKDVWHAIDICGYKTVLQTMDGLTPEQRWICMKR